MIRPASTIHAAVEQQFAATPEAAAVACGEVSLTCAELELRASRLARELRRRGVSTGSIVALCATRSLEQMVAVLAILKSGAALLPLDPVYPAERLRYMLADSRAQLVLTQPPFAAMLPHSSVLCLDVAEAAAGNGSAEPTNERDPAALAYVIYTSGSTGKPKGIAMPHRAITNLLAWHHTTLPLSAGARVAQFSSLSFDVSFQEIFTTWAEGGALVLLDEETRRDPTALWQFLWREKITRLFLPFVALQQLAEAAPEQPPATLLEVITAGEQLRITPQIRTLFQRLPSCRLHNHYGPSETHVATAHTLAGDPASWPLLPPIGHAIANVEVRLLRENRAPVAFEESGEICLGGACLADGYLHRPELTAERFVELDGARFYQTGDFARRAPDGTLDFLGRRDEQVKVRGFRVELAEIEAALSGHPRVRECAVLAHEDRLLAYVIGPGCEMHELRSYLAAELPPHMVPSLFVALPKMPLTPSGKIDRRALPTLGESAPAPIMGNPLERVIGGIWQQVLQVARVGLDDNFFDLGGTSLSIVHAQQLLAREMQHEIAVTELFQFPTVRGLARHLSNGATALGSQAQTRADLQRAALARRRPQPVLS